MTKETMESIDPNDTMIHMDTIKAISGTAQDHLIDSRDAIHKAQIDSKIIHPNVTTAHAEHPVLASEIDVQDFITNIYVLTYSYATFHALDVGAHNITLQIENVLHHLNKSGRI